MQSLNLMLHSPSFYIIFLTFSTYVGFFNAFSSLLNQILYPYGYSEDEAGICGAVLLAVGLLTSLVTTPIVDRTHAYLLGIKLLCPLVAGAYLGVIWTPQTRSIAAPYVLSAVLGASSFSLLPISLEVSYGFRCEGIRGSVSARDVTNVASSSTTLRNPVSLI
jgi:FLVCR family MFS transporter 7